MIQREYYLSEIEKLFRTHRIVVLIGPRQVGKTTLANQVRKKYQSSLMFDLENPEDFRSLSTPLTTLTPLSGLIIIDEIQRQPDLFLALRYIHDEFPDKKFLLLGSTSRELIQHSSESLAGRLAYVELPPFNLLEVPDFYKLWMRGGFPKSYMAETDNDSFIWRTHYIRSFLEQDIPAMGIGVNTSMLRQFWDMLSHYHGQIFNSSAIGQSLGISHTSAKNYLDILSQTFMIRLLKPWHANTKKRQLKSPKIYWRDSGILHNFLHTTTYNDLLKNPKIGASFEGFALEQVIRQSRVDEYDCYFWGAHSYGEIDLLLHHKGHLYGFEFKLNDAPTFNKNWRSIMTEIGLKSLSIIYPGEKHYAFEENINACGIQNKNLIEICLN